MKKPNLGPDKGTTGKELSKSPFKKIGDDLNKEIEYFHKLITKIITKHPLEPEADLLKAFEMELAASKDPVGTWIKSNALEQLGYNEIAVKFKEKAMSLGYKIESVMESKSEFSRQLLNIKMILKNLMKHSEGNSEVVTQLNNLNKQVENLNFLIFKKLVNENTDTTKPTFVTTPFVIKNIPNTLHQELKNILKIGQTVNVIKSWRNANEPLFGLNVLPNVGINTNELQELQGKSSTLEGKKIKLIAIKENVENIATGTQGTIINHDLESDIISVKWDNGETTPILPEDKFEVLAENCITPELGTQHLPLEDATKLTPGNELSSQSKQPLEDEPEYSENALVALIRNDVFLSFAFDQSQTDDRSKDLEKFYKHYIKGDDKMEHILKTFEKIQSK